ncbi:MAG: lysozyme [Candidatus Nitrosotenuis sp.]
MRISEQGLTFIASFEGLRTRLYNDPAGHCTIGVGHLVHLGPCNGSEPLEFRRGISEARALELLREDARRFEDAVNRLVAVRLTQNQFDALVSFAFNVGVGAFGRSTLLRKLNVGDVWGAAQEFLRWTLAGGVELPGLRRRRKAEQALFLQGWREKGGEMLPGTLLRLSDGRVYVDFGTGIHHVPDMETLKLGKELAIYKRMRPKPVSLAELNKLRRARGQPAVR